MARSASLSKKKCSKGMSPAKTRAEVLICRPKCRSPTRRSPVNPYTCVKPCAASYVRNPKTNRCALPKNLKSPRAITMGTPCASPTAHRNPKTGRCRANHNATPIRRDREAARKRAARSAARLHKALLSAPSGGKSPSGGKGKGKGASPIGKGKTVVDMFGNYMWASHGKSPSGGKGKAASPIGGKGKGKGKSPKVKAKSVKRNELTDKFRTFLGKLGPLPEMDQVLQLSREFSVEVAKAIRIVRAYRAHDLA